jgi:hypothetical protein
VEFQARARIAASAALASARENASAQELEAIAKGAIQPLIQKFEHDERIESAVRYLTLPNGTSNEDQEARELARAALSALPVDASRRQFEQAKEDAIAPIPARIVARMQKQAEEAERQALMARINSWVSPELSIAEKGTALAEANKAVAALPAGTSNDDREKAAREVVNRQTAKKKLIEEGLREVPRHARRLRWEYRYSPNETAWDIAQRLKEKVEERLRQELDGSEDPEDVVERVQTLMEEFEGCTD